MSATLEQDARLLLTSRVIARALRVAQPDESPQTVVPDHLVFIVLDQSLAPTWVLGPASEAFSFEYRERGAASWLGKVRQAIQSSTDAVEHQIGAVNWKLTISSLQHTALPADGYAIYGYRIPPRAP